MVQSIVKFYKTFDINTDEIDEFINQLLILFNDTKCGVDSWSIGFVFLGFRASNDVEFYLSLGESYHFKISCLRLLLYIFVT